jgi:protocatechuate 3,4-dioxygenase beta subunit
LKKAIIITGVMLLLAGGALGQQDRTQGTSQPRSVSGAVMDKSDAALADAVVYLQNTKSLAVKTFITDASGQYRFHGLSPNVDYEIYAEHQGRKSGTKTLSAFDSRSTVTINLKIDK